MNTKDIPGLSMAATVMATALAEAFNKDGFGNIAQFGPEATKVVQEAVRLILEPPSIRWISVTERVPDDRRRVITWGRSSFLGMNGPAEGQFLGETKYNPKANGRGRFDNERVNSNIAITHWAELEGPVINRPAPPPAP